MKHLVLIFSVLIIFYACGGDQAGTQSGSDTLGSMAEQLSKIQELETAQKSVQGRLDNKMAKEMMDTYLNFSTEYSTHENAALYLYEAADKARHLGDFSSAIKCWEKIIQEYPTFEKSGQSLFLIGYVQENNLNKLAEAKATYEQFLVKYPEHELADDVQFSLANLGKSPDEIIKMFEEQNKLKEAKGK